MFNKIMNKAIYSRLQANERLSYHEIRSLSIDQHKKLNLDAQLAADHTTEQMTENYRKNREEIIWTDVVDELDFKIAGKGKAF